MSIKIAVIKSFAGMTAVLAPATEDDAELLKSMKLGETYTFEFKKMRNSQFHRKFFALLKIVLDNMPDEIRDQRNIHTMDGFLIDLKLLLGHYDLFVSIEGTPMYVPKSISFSAMGQEEFERFYKRTIDIVISKHTAGMDGRELERMVSQVVNFA